MLKNALRLFLIGIDGFIIILMMFAFAQSVGEVLSTDQIDQTEQIEVVSTEELSDLSTIVVNLIMVRVLYWGLFHVASNVLLVGHSMNDEKSKNYPKESPSPIMPEA